MKKITCERERLEKVLERLKYGEGHLNSLMSIWEAEMQFEKPGSLMDALERLQNRNIEDLTYILTGNTLCLDDEGGARYGK